jgi:ribonuclease HII
VVKEERVVDELVCGIDEAGRGPIAGPVTAAAVILPPGFPVEILADSKVLSPARRARAAARIKETAIAWAVGWATHEEIDSLNIHHATLLAMKRAVEALAVKPGRILVDGLYCPATGIPSEPVVKGDATIPQIMAASILAKTSRDAWMERYAEVEPSYGYERHKGYPTAEHREIVRRLGPSRIQRTSFRVSPPSS